MQQANRARSTREGMVPVRYEAGMRPLAVAAGVGASGAVMQQRKGAAALAWSIRPFDPGLQPDQLAADHGHQAEVLDYRGRGQPRPSTRHAGHLPPRDMAFALFWSDVQWVKNVLVAGEATLEVRRRRIRLVDPVLIVDPDRRIVRSRAPVRMGLMRVGEFYAYARSGPDFGSRGPPGRWPMASAARRHRPSWR